MCIGWGLKIFLYLKFTGVCIARYLLKNICKIIFSDSILNEDDVRQSLQILPDINDINEMTVNEKKLDRYLI